MAQREPGLLSDTLALAFSDHKILFSNGLEGNLPLAERRSADVRR